MGAGPGDLAGMAQILTNRSAGAVGLMMSGVLGMGIGLGGDLSGGPGEDTQRPFPSPAQVRL